jgi:diaminopimelate decarboxylase
VDLAGEFGTPLYIFDEATLRGSCREYRDEFSRSYDNVLVIYAAKASISRALAQIIREEGLGLDVVSGGELSVALSVDFPMDRVYFHGNNKSREEIEMALAAGTGRIVVDNLHELALLDQSAGAAGVVQDIMLRLTPGIDAHTHRHVATGIIDSKFGLSIVSGQAEEAVAAAMKAPNLNLVGLHVHLGSLIFTSEPYQEATRTVFEFAAAMKERHGFDLREYSPGGGFAVQYTKDAPAPGAAYYASAIAESIRRSSADLNVRPPRLVVEPGRSIVARSCVAVYTAGAVKEIPGVRRYVPVDGGMADNIRPALYGSRYEALLANKAAEGNSEKVTLAGKFCESGDILVTDAELPSIEPGDTVVIPVSGAYNLSLASNYNASLKPAIVMVKGGNARLVRRRETYDDLIRNDVV